jgi:hypothetical protein
VWLSGKPASPSPPSATLRNTVRGVVPVRLSDQERGQIAGAAARLGLHLLGVCASAALQASAVLGRKVVVQAAEPPEPEHLLEPRAGEAHGGRGVPRANRPGLRHHSAPNLVDEARRQRAFGTYPVAQSLPKRRETGPVEECYGSGQTPVDVPANRPLRTPPPSTAPVRWRSLGD